jgi:hypothetical protein
MTAPSANLRARNESYLNAVAPDAAVLAALDTAVLVALDAAIGVTRKLAVRGLPMGAGQPPAEDEVDALLNRLIAQATARKKLEAALESLMSGDPKSAGPAIFPQANNHNKSNK